MLKSVFCVLPKPFAMLTKATSRVVVLCHEEKEKKESNSDRDRDHDIYSRRRPLVGLDLKFIYSIGSSIRLVLAVFGSHMGRLLVCWSRLRGPRTVGVKPHVVLIIGRPFVCSRGSLAMHNSSHAF